MNFQGSKVTLTALELKALAAFASKDETRPALNGIWFDFGARTASATDGHTAIAWGLPNARPRSADRVCVPVKQVAALLALAACSPSKSVTIGYDVSDGLDIDHAEAEQPAVEKVFAEHGAGSEKSGWAWAFNAEYGARLVAVQRAAESISVTAWAPSGDLGPTLYSAKGWRVLIMPIRCDSTRDADSMLKARNARFWPAAAPQKRAA